MEEPITKVFITKNGKDETFYFPLLADETPRLKNKKIIDIQTHPNFGKEWLDTPDGNSTLAGNLTQAITFDDGEIIERIVQVRTDGTHHGGSKFHINIDILRKGAISSEFINYKKEVESHFIDRDVDKVEEIWIGIGYNGETIIQPIAFVSNQKQRDHADRQKEIFRRALHTASAETGIEVEEL